MPNPTIQSLLKKIGQPDLIKKISEDLTGSEFNSLLLELFRANASRLTPQELLKAYEENRFVKPSDVDGISFAETSLRLLTLARDHGFEPLELSPLAPIGNCSSIALVDQNKVISAARGTEVVADATNLMALESSVRRKASRFDANDLSLCSVHRHVRAQALPDIKGFTAHFKIFCAVTAGRDRGALDFEKKALLSHLLFYRNYFIDELRMDGVKVIIKGLKEEGEPSQYEKLYESLLGSLPGVDLSLEEVLKEDHQYYRHLRFSLNIIFKGKEINIGDGGFVDWAQKLMSNNKERLFTSGMGIELLLKLRLGMIG